MNTMPMECDDCHAEWKCLEEQPDERCPKCDGTAVHWKVSDAAVLRMRGILGTRKATPEQLKAAFAASTVGGETYADAVLTRAVEIGYIELIDDTVWNPDRNK